MTVSGTFMQLAGLWADFQGIRSASATAESATCEGVMRTTADLHIYLWNPCESMYILPLPDGTRTELEETGAVTLNGERVECQLRDPCVQCMHGVPHPPLLIAYDEAAGNYDYTPERVCMARWASTNGSHKAGSICGASATHHAGDVDLCQHHFNRVYEWRFWEKPLQDIKEKTAAIKAADAEYRQAVRESEVHRERVRAEMSVVYYIRRVSDGMIKIGTTREFRTRMATHRSENGEMQILLTHSGTRKEEREAHLRFDVYRVGRSEWFHPTRPLLSWILDTRRIESHKKTQGLDILPQAELRKLIRATPPDAYQWRRGKLVPVRRPAA